jgi:hypothetical protein
MVLPASLACEVDVGVVVEVAPVAVAHGKHHTGHRARESWTRSTGAICTVTNFSSIICPSTTRVTGLAREPGGAQRPSSVAQRCGVAQG